MSNDKVGVFERIKILYRMKKKKTEKLWKMLLLSQISLNDG